MWGWTTERVWDARRYVHEQAEQKRATRTTESRSLTLEMHIEQRPGIQIWRPRSFLDRRALARRRVQSKDWRTTGGDCDPAIDVDDRSQLSGTGLAAGLGKGWGCPFSSFRRHALHIPVPELTVATRMTPATRDRLCTLSFSSRLCTWFLTVATSMHSAVAISLFDRSCFRR